MFILETTFCTSASGIATILFIKNIVKILSIIVPAILILLLSIDFAKAVIAADDDKIKRAQSLAIKRIIYGVVVFFVPMIVDVAFGLIDSDNVQKSCFTNATDEVLDSLSQAEKEKLIQNDSDREKLIKAAKKSKLAYDKEIRKLRLTAAAKKDNSISTSDAQEGISGMAAKIVSTAKEQSWPLGTSSSTYHSKYYKSRHSADCGAFAKMVVNKAIKKDAPGLLGAMLENKKRGSDPSKFNKKIKKYGLTAYAWDGSMSSLIPGDLLIYKKGGGTSGGRGQHIMIYLGKHGKDYLIAEASYPKHYYGHLTTKKGSSGQLNKKSYAYYYVVRAN